MPKARPTRTNTGGPRRIGPEDEDRQSQLDDGARDKRGTDEDVLKDGERRSRDGAVDDTDLSDLPRR